MTYAAYLRIYELANWMPRGPPANICRTVFPNPTR